jgi:hypothetical protein
MDDLTHEIADYVQDSGCTDTPNKMPTDRSIVCPGWEKAP